MVIRDQSRKSGVCAPTTFAASTRRRRRRRTAARRSCGFQWRQHWLWRSAAGPACFVLRWTKRELSIARSAARFRVFTVSTCWVSSLSDRRLTVVVCGLCGGHLRYVEKGSGSDWNDEFVRILSWGLHTNDKSDRLLFTVDPAAALDLQRGRTFANDRVRWTENLCAHYSRLTSLQILSDLYYVQMQLYVIAVVKAVSEKKL